MVRVVGDVGDGQGSRPEVGLEWGSELTMYWTSKTSKTEEKGQKITVCSAYGGKGGFASVFEVGGQCYGGWRCGGWSTE